MSSLLSNDRTIDLVNDYKIIDFFSHIVPSEKKEKMRKKEEKKIEKIKKKRTVIDRSGNQTVPLKCLLSRRFVTGVVPHWRGTNQNERNAPSLECRPLCVRAWSGRFECLAACAVLSAPVFSLFALDATRRFSLCSTTVSRFCSRQ